MLREGLQRDSESQPGLCQCASPAPVVSQRTPFHFPSHRREPGERLWTQRKNNQNDGFGQRLSFRDRERKIMVPTQSFPQSWFGQRLSYRDRERERDYGSNSIISTIMVWAKTELEREHETCLDK